VLTKHGKRYVVFIACDGWISRDILSGLRAACDQRKTPDFSYELRCIADSG
jgi:hypothetical protein